MPMNGTSKCHPPVSPLHPTVFQEAAYISTDHFLGPPISKLSYDILWRIFLTNAYLDTKFTTNDDPLYHALNVARHTSQVCHQWREVVLGSPTIWANLIDLDVLRKPERWRNEVLKRTGNASLYIQGELWFAEIMTQYPSLLFIFDLLNDHWGRIRSLNIDIDGILFLGHYLSRSPQKWKVLQRPSPVLKFLRITFSRDEKDFQECDGFFPAYAPSLTQFHCPRMRFNIHAPWIPQLCTITLSDNIHSISELFSLLTNMPILESFELQREFQVTDLERTQNVSRAKILLPRLKHIKLDNGPTACRMILEQITPSQGCVSYLELGHLDMSTRDSEDFVEFQPLLTRYSEMFFNEGPRATSLSLFSDAYNFTVWSSKASSPPIFKFNIHSFDFGQDMTPLFVKSFSSSEFSHITLFRFYVLLEPEYLLPILSQFLIALHSVATMEVNPNALRILLDFPVQTGFLPSLHTLTLNQSTAAALQISSSGYARDLLSFLTLRKNAGVPISILDLTLFPFFHLGNLQFLEEVTGLKVRWTRYSDYMVEEYICGSGIAGALDFRVNVKEIEDRKRIYRIPPVKRWDI